MDMQRHETPVAPGPTPMLATSVSTFSSPTWPHPANRGWLMVGLTLEVVGGMADTIMLRLRAQLS